MSMQSQASIDSLRLILAAKLRRKDSRNSDFITPRVSLFLSLSLLLSPKRVTSDFTAFRCCKVPTKSLNPFSRITNHKSSSFLRSSKTVIPRAKRGILMILPLSFPLIPRDYFNIRSIFFVDLAWLIEILICRGVMEQIHLG